MSKIVAMALVGGRGSRLEEITKNTAKPAVSFGGKYKLIDFVLSNLIHSRIDRIGLLTQYEPHELMRYIGNGSTWDLDLNDGGIHFLTPFTSKNGEQWQKGTAHAIAQHFRFIEQYNSEHVLILSGDHIYKMDYHELFKTHLEKDADITIGAFKVHTDASRYGILEVNKDCKVTGFEEKPENPKSSNASMGVYIFKTEILKELLQTKELNDFGKDIIPYALKKGYKIFGHRYSGYFKDVGTLKTLFEANMDLIDNPHFLKLHEYRDFPIYTKSSNLPPHHITKDAQVVNSLISDGCLVEGKLNHTILSSGCFVSKNTTLKNVIAFDNVTIEEDVHLENCFILKDTIIKKGTSHKFNSVRVIDNEILGELNE